MFSEPTKIAMTAPVVITEAEQGNVTLLYKLTK